jgi:hypothetical protein
LAGTDWGVAGSPIHSLWVTTIPELFPKCPKSPVFGDYTKGLLEPSVFENQDGTHTSEIWLPHLRDGFIVAKAGFPSSEQPQISPA